jgi:hypothetical protein
MTVHLTSKSTPVLIAAITIIAYGLLLPFTGFYWDDWPFAWIAKFLGPQEFIPAFAPFRPFLGPIFFFTTSLIPPVPLYWQIFALIIRFLIGLAAWWMFRQVWPSRPQAALAAALFVLVFPGYSQHWVAFTHINQELIPLILFLLSFGFTFKALRSERPFTYTIIALLLGLCGIFPTEYFFGLEGLRGLFLFAHFQGNFSSRLRNTFRHWWPYLLIWTLNAAWLIYYYRFGPYNSYEVTATQTLNSITIFQEMLDTLWKTCFYIWYQILILASSSLPTPASNLTLSLIAVSFAALGFFLFRSPLAREDGVADAGDRTFPLTLLLVGLLGILLGRLPSLAAGLPLRLQSSYDRFMVSMMIGGSLFALGVIELFFRRSRFKMIAVALLVALGIGQQFFNANIFRRDWARQGQIYWQMTWRIPALKPGTVLLTHQMPIDYETDISFTAPVNWMYAPEFTRSDLPYLMLYTEKRLGGSTLPSLEPDTGISFPYRTVTFHGNTSHAVVIYMPDNGCLRVLDPARGDAETYARQSKYLTKTIPLSNLSRVVTDTDTPAIPMFFPEPVHDWCYYFIQAEIAQQKGDLERVIAIGREAASLGYAPEDPYEWLVFIEAYALTGDLRTAEKLSAGALSADPRVGRGVCVLWKRVQAQSPAGSGDEISGILSRFECLP